MSRPIFRRSAPFVFEVAAPKTVPPGIYGRSAGRTPATRAFSAVPPAALRQPGRRFSRPAGEGQCDGVRGVGFFWEDLLLILMVCAQKSMFFCEICRTFCEFFVWNREICVFCTELFPKKGSPCSEDPAQGGSFGRPLLPARFLYKQPNLCAGGYLRSSGCRFCRYADGPANNGGGGNACGARTARPQIFSQRLHTFANVYR